MSWLGIDPGLTGCTALVLPENKVMFWDTPFVEVASPSAHKTKGGKVPTRTLYDDGAMASVIAAAVVHAGGNPTTVLESVHAMPKQGVASTFKFGIGFGIWRGILAARGLPYHLVDSRRWTNLLLKDLPRGDEAAVIRASQLYPAYAGELRTPRGRLLLGRADALLLAHYARLMSPTAA